jgi:hypothetical protein
MWEMASVRELTVLIDKMRSRYSVFQSSSTAGRVRQEMFWCAGCHGTMYPMNGNISAEYSKIQAALLATERKKTARWLPDIPIYEMQVGTEEGQIRISRLQKEMGKLPKNLRPAESNDIRRRLDALSQRQNAIPLPKGPMPRQSR